MMTQGYPMWAVPDDDAEPNVKIIIGWNMGRPVVVDADLVNDRSDVLPDGGWSAFTDVEAARAYVEARERNEI